MREYDHKPSRLLWERYMRGEVLWADLNREQKRIIGAINKELPTSPGCNVWD